MNVMEWKYIFVILVLFGTLYMPSGNNFIVRNQCFQGVYVIFISFNQLICKEVILHYYFLSVSWRLHGQLCATDEGTASLT